MPGSRQPTELKLSGIFGGSLSHVLSGRDFVCLFLNLTGPLSIYYGSQFCVFIGFLCVRMCMSLCLYDILMLIFGSCLFVLSCSYLLYFIIIL